mgnify:FL=1
MSRLGFAFDLLKTYYYYYYFSVHWIPPECYYDFKLAKTIPSADVWAFGTTLWEIFSFGATPDMGNDKDVGV